MSLASTLVGLVANLTLSDTSLHCHQMIVAILTSPDLSHLWRCYQVVCASIDARLRYDHDLYGIYGGGGVFCDRDLCLDENVSLNVFDAWLLLPSRQQAAFQILRESLSKAVHVDSTEELQDKLWAYGSKKCVTQGCPLKILGGVSDIE